MQKKKMTGLGYISCPGLVCVSVNPGSAEQGYVPSLRKVYFQISWLLKKPSGLDLYCLSLSMQICNNSLDEVI